MKTCLYRYIAKSLTRDVFPDVVRIEPAGVCNFHCQHCPVGCEGGKRGLMSLDDFRRVLLELPVRPRVLVLYHGGEPLLNKDLPKMVNYAKSWGVKRIVVDSNISLLSPDMDLHNIDELRVAFAGTSPDEHERVRLGADFAQDVRLIKQLSESPHRPYRIVLLSIGNGRVADYLLDEFTGNGCDNGIMFQSLIEKRWARAGVNDDAPTDVRYCRNLFTTFTILANGDVALCNDDLMGDSIHGNVFKDSALKIWERMQVLRDGFERGEYPDICKSCYVVRGF